MAPQAKFDFVPVSDFTSQKDSDTVTITKNGMICFSKCYSTRKDLSNKFLRFYIDDKKNSLAWRIVESEKNIEDLKGIRKIVPGKDGVCKLSITKILGKFTQQVKGTKYPQLEIKTYNGSYLENEVDYVIIK